jgi:hypothetical protein
MDESKIIFVPYPSSEFFTKIEAVIESCVVRAYNDCQQKERSTKLLAINDVMKLYGVSRRCVNNWRKKGLPEHRMPGTVRVFFKEKEIMEMMQIIRPYKKVQL